jgi:hypothetical protein
MNDSLPNDHDESIKEKEKRKAVPKASSNIKCAFDQSISAQEALAMPSVMSAPAGRHCATGRPWPPLSKQSIDFDHEIMENEKKL